MRNASRHLNNSYHLLGFLVHYWHRQEDILFLPTIVFESIQQYQLTSEPNFSQSFFPCPGAGKEFKMAISIEAGLLTREKAVSHMERTRNGYSSENVCQV